MMLTNITRPSGIIKRRQVTLEESIGLYYAKIPNRFVMALDNTLVGTKYTWQFRLTQELGLNITFLRIDIGYGTLQKCFIGNISVKTFNFPSNNTSIFCGVYSEMKHYPAYKNIDIVISAEYKTVYDVTFLFSVMDPNIIWSCSIDVNTSIQPMWALYIPAKKLIIEQFHIKAFPFQKLKINVTTVFFSVVDVIDGPGLLGIKLVPGRHTIDETINSTELKTAMKLDEYNTFSFQCIIKLRKTIKSHSTISYVSYTRKNDIEVVLLSNKTFNISFPRQSLKLFEIWMIIFQSEKYIDLSIDKFTFAGKPNYQCCYGGIFTYNVIKNDNQQISSLCHTHPVKFPNVYSAASRMLLVLYTYHKYGTLKATIVMNTTFCRAIVINTCSLGPKCFHTNPTLCNLLSSVDILKQKCVRESPHLLGKCSSEDLLLEISLEEEKCVIIQFRHRTDQFKNLFHPYDIIFFPLTGVNIALCSVKNMYHVPLKKKGKRIDYTLKGVLSPGKYYDCYINFETTTNKIKV